MILANYYSTADSVFSSIKFERLQLAALKLFADSTSYLPVRSNCLKCLRGVAHALCIINCDVNGRMFILFGNWMGILLSETVILTVFYQAIYNLLFSVQDTGN